MTFYDKIVVFTTIITAAPYQVPEDVTKKIVEGESLELPCNYNTADGSEVRWNFNGKDLPLSNRISQVMHYCCQLTF